MGSPRAKTPESVTDYLRREIEAKRIQEGLQHQDVVAALGMTWGGYIAFRDGETDGISCQTLALAESWLGFDLETLLTDHAPKPLSPTIIKTEAKRIREGLTDQAIAEALKLNIKTYTRLVTGQRHMPFRTCGAFALWLDVPAKDVLHWEGYWDKLSPLGKLIAPPMLTAGLNIEQFAEETKTSIATVSHALWKGPGHSREPAILDRWADTLGLSVTDLHRACREIREVRGPWPTPYIDRLRKKRGTHGLRIHGERLHQLRMKQTTAEERQRQSREKGVPGLRAWWASATETERLRFRLSHLDPRPKGRFSICRVCGKINYTGPALVRAGQRGEAHGACIERWRSEAHEYSEWGANAQAARRLGLPVPHPPTPAYPNGRRPDATELAHYYETTVLYIRAKLRAKDRRPDLKELFDALSISTRTLYDRLDRFAELLPDPEVCGQEWGERVRLLKASLQGYKRAG